ncbi:MAG: HAMP domain-containing sensor histidine kinase [Bacteroidota bacterium]
MKAVNKLYIKLSAIFLLMLLVLGGIYVAISHYISADYVSEVNQELYGDIAEYTVREVQPMMDSQIDTSEVQEIMHSMMVINPSVEVYLLDPEGEIITYVAPYKKVVLDRVNLAPLKEFIGANPEDRPFIKGDDPRKPGREKIFSAAEMRDEAGILKGYAYIILASEEQTAVVSYLQGSYMFRLGKNLFFISLLAASIIGLFALWYLTRNLRRVTETVSRFKAGDYSARIPDQRRGDFKELANTFNDMAGTIESNIDELKSVEKLRRELIANVSHDLRTPLAIIRGYVETMQMKNSDLSEEERGEYLQTVLNSTEKLSGLIEQLFEYSKLEAKQIEPDLQAFQLSELAQDVANKFAMLAKEKEVTVELDAPEHLPLIFADLGLVERVLNNLMDNAIKFTPHGGSVRLTMHSNNDSVEVSVADSGPGIPEEDQAHIFDRYKKAYRTSGGKANQGAGLGLAIVKKILELHNQSIQVKSQVREGTTFIFNLPVTGQLSV